jgi:hypothetical protein
MSQAISGSLACAGHKSRMAVGRGPERERPNVQMNLIPRWTTAVWAICLILAEPAISAEDAFDGNYTGERVLTKGPVPPCAAKDNVSVTIQAGTLTFTDSLLRNVVIGFEPHQDGSFNRIYTDIGGGTVLIEGRVTGDVLEADVINGPSLVIGSMHSTQRHRELARRLIGISSPVQTVC